MFGTEINFGEGLIVTALGMGVTFAALIALSFMLDILRIVFYKEPKKAPAPVAEVKPEPVVEVVEESNSEELIAVIAAAIAASLKTTTHNIIVKNIVRVPDTTPAWSKAGRLDQLNSRF